MSRPRRHRFDVGTARAKEIQESLREDVRIEPLRGPIRRVAGADISFTRRSSRLFGAVVVLDADTGEVLERASARVDTRFPYVPGYLSFRELPCLLRAFDKLRESPDLVLADGHGRAHPRRFGLACHLGVLLDLPTIGCAKSRLVGRHGEPGEERGDRVAIVDRGERIGTLLRTQPSVKPVYVSIGHRVDLRTAARAVLRLAPTTRLPDPARAAHREANRVRVRSEGSGARSSGGKRRAPPAPRPGNSLG